MSDRRQEPKLDHGTITHLGDFGFDTPESLASICADMCDRMKDFDGISLRSRDFWYRAASLSAVVAQYIREAIEHQDDTDDAEWLEACRRGLENNEL